MGPLLKGAGAVTFLLDYFLRGSPSSFLLFAASDGTLALITLYGLLGLAQISNRKIQRCLNRKYTGIPAAMTATPANAVAPLRIISFTTIALHASTKTAGAHG